MSHAANSKKKRRPIAAVVGSSTIDEQTKSEAALLGRAIIDGGFRLVSGGLGGAMKAASKGAHQSANYQPGDVIGILPTYKDCEANEYVDIPICTGLNHARNLIVVATSEVVFALGGQSGTLSEIAFAWTLGKLVISVGSSEGWAKELSGRQIDGRRGDKVYGPEPPEKAVELAIRLLADHAYGPKTF